MQYPRIGTLVCLLLCVISLNYVRVNAQTTLTTTPLAETTLLLADNSTTVTGAGVRVDGNQITIEAVGTYRLSGTLNDGQVIVDTEDAGLVTLMLDNVTLNSTTSAPIYIKQADSTAIFLMEGTANYVSDAPVYQYENVEDDEPNAAVFSDDDLTIYGTGSLTVKANFNDGIASKDTLNLLDSTLTIQAVDDGIRGKDALIINGTQIQLTAQGDGLKADEEEDSALGYIRIEGGTFNIQSGGDAIQAQTTLTINDGDFTIVSGGGSHASLDESLSAKGLKAITSVFVYGGNFALDSADDALHSNGQILVQNGTFNIATGDDGLHADSQIEINGGSFNITQSYEGIESSIITINGGEIRLVASDDGLNVAGGVDNSGFGGRPEPGNRPNIGGTAGNYFLYLNGGVVVVYAEGDGLDANGSIEMHGGIVIVHGPVGNMNGALDYDGSFKITGGILVAAGSSGMLQAPDNSSTQYSLAVGFETALSAGTLVHIENSAGETLLTFAPDKNYQALVFSSPQLVGGETYTLYQGGSAVGNLTDGLYADETYQAGTVYTNLPLTSVTTQLGGGGGPRGFGGRP